MMRHESRLLWTVLASYALGAMVCFARTASAQISPGPLAAPHATLDRPLTCTQCHAGGGATMTTRCLACHTEIAALRAQGRGLHARAGKGECAQCHPDHAGRDFALVKWPDGSRDKFDHARAGWALEEKHARLTCEKCHTADLRVSPIASLGPQRTKAGWTGLETTCASCHRDVHTGSLGRDCKNCHTVAGWSPAPGFDHAKSDYPLTGKHADVSCEKCHTEPARVGGDAKPAAVRFKPLAHTDCVSCHRDPHAGRLQGACSGCHVTTGFSTVNDRAFSHDRTRYPLRGRHAAVSCASCHTGYPGRMEQPAFATCGACHSDPHAGTATLAGATVDCASCHTVSGFAPSTFTVAQHARTAYPLQGKHATVKCAGCHVRGGAVSPVRGRVSAAQPGVVMRPAADRCESCHTDAHGGQLAGRGARGACATCHTPAGWKPSTFGPNEHSALRFPLTGRHAAVDCASCHSSKRRDLPAFPATRSLGAANVALSLDETTCESCHRDPHSGRYGKNATMTAGSCASCHDTRAFHPSTISVAGHAQFAFALEGAHGAAPCGACHTAMKSASLGASLKMTPAASTALVYTISNATCSTCHEAPHGKQFAKRQDGGSCQGCHDLRGWSPPSRFDHEANGGFPLGTAHARVPCARCHVVPPGATAAARIWRGVSRTCESCHKSPPSRRD